MLYYLISFLLLFTSLLCLAYVFLIGAFCAGWKKTNNTQKEPSAKIKAAIIVAARNEEDTIAACIDSIIKQTYPVSNYELIIVNDNSTDRTEEIIREYLTLHQNIRLINLSDSFLQGKKKAIATAIKATDAELIVTTDADCIMGNNWLKKIVSYYNQTNAKMIVSPVAFHQESGFFQKMQSLEMMALMGSTCGSLYYGKAIMCNGANLAYKREVFNELNGFSGIDEIPTGDDVLLMYKVNEKYNNSIRFFKDQEAIVYIKTMAKLSDFVEQRKRWASKKFNSLNLETKVVSGIVYLFNLMVLLMGAITGFASLKSAVYLPFFQICLILFGIKCIIDFLLLFLAASFFNKKKLLYLFLPEQFVYLFYIVVIGMLGSIGKYSWKGRKY